MPDLPGLENKDNLKIKWLNARTFLIETKMERPEIEEQETIGEEADDGTTATKPAQEDHGHSNSDYKRTDVALTVHERRLGLFARAFSFPTEVCHEKLEANLHAGLLRIKVPKNVVDVVKSEHKEIEVKHSDA